MNELFFSDGHLTDEALQGLIDGSLDELSRLEVGEHLSYCDACLDRYTALLTADTLEEPENNQTLPIMRKVYKRQVDNATRRYATAVAAVAIGSILWYAGVFSTVGKILVESPQTIMGQNTYQQQVVEQEPQEEKESLSRMISKAVDDWSMRVRDAAAPAFRAPNRSTERFNNNTVED